MATKPAANTPTKAPEAPAPAPNPTPSAPAAKTKAKRPRKVNLKKDFTAGTCVATFVGTGKVLTYSLADLLPAMVRHCALHGLIQKCSDPYSQKGSDAYVEASDAYDSLKNGVWYEKRTPGAPRVGVTVQALFNLLGVKKGWKDLKDAFTFFAALSEEKREALGKTKEVVAEIGRMKNEAAKAAPSIDSVLA